MHVTGKVMIGLGLVMFIFGAVIMGVGIGKGVDDLQGLEDTVFSVENATSGTIEMLDNDAQGELGVTFWVRGEYVDDDENGIWDVCDDTNITVTEHPEVNSDWAEDGNTLGGFYYEVIDFYDGCESDIGNQNHDLNDRGYVKVGRACLACYAGTFEFESNASVSVTYDDVVLEQLGEGFFALLGGSVLGGLCLCCGGLVGLTGLILGLTMKTSPAVTAMHPAHGMPGQPAAQAAYDFQQAEPPT